ncbi:MAG: hypothetical protein ACI9UR_001063 [Bacteroidia bacterium]|jgi:hypothetical protein
MIRTRILIICLSILAHSVMGQTQLWERVLPGVGTFASPRTWDLNQDGVKDVLIGDGSEQDSIGHFHAFDGATGDTLWSVLRNGEIYTSPQFSLVNQDNYEDVIVGGRVFNLFCVDGLDGTLIWEFDTSQASPEGQGWLQFYEPKTINDITSDGVRELVVINGGDVSALPGETNRKPGYLMLLDGFDGTVLNMAVMPDTAESYSSVVIVEGNDPETTKIYFGSGGETLKGSLWMATLEQLMSNDISNAFELIEGVDKGFIAPPVLVDLNSDNHLDIVAAGFDGTMTMVNGASLGIEWTYSNTSFEVYGTPGIGDFDGNGQLDVIGSFARGSWPAYDYSVQVMFQGNTGAIMRMDTIGSQHSSVLVYDVDNDGKDEGILSFADNSFFQTGQAILNFDTGVQVSFMNLTSTNIASTSSLDDLDGDGDLELMEIRSINPMEGYTLKVWDTPYSVNNPLKWTAYHGTNYDGIYELVFPVEVANVALVTQRPCVYYQNNRAEIKFTKTPKEVRLFDLVGKPISLKKSGLTYRIKNASSGIYILQYQYQYQHQVQSIKVLNP